MMHVKVDQILVYLNLNFKVKIDSRHETKFWELVMSLKNNEDKMLSENESIITA